MYLLNTAPASRPSNAARNRAMTTIEEAAISWLDWLRDIRRLRPKTILQYRTHIAQFIRFVRFYLEKPAPTVSDVDAHIIMQYLSERKRGGWADTTYNSAAIVFHGFGTYLRLAGYSCPSAESALINAGRIDRPKKKARYVPTDEEVARMFAAAQTWREPWRTRNLAILGIFCATGLRRTEFLALRWSDVSEASLHVRDGKGGKSRNVAMPPQCAALLFAYYSLLEVKGKPVGPEDRVWQQEGKHVIGHGGLQRLFEELLYRAGLEHLIGTLTPHCLRHYAVTSWLSRGGASLVEAMTQAGHSDVRTTSLYTHQLRSLPDATKFEPGFLGGTEIKQPVAARRGGFCAQCGAALPAGSRFCPECGEKVG